MPIKRPFKNVYQLKIKLLDTNPPVWRRILVPESYTFYDLHVAIQNAMGWTDSHLHSFEIKLSMPMTNRKRILTIDCPFSELEDINEGPIYMSTEISIEGYLNKEKDKALYTYDFGDSWDHEIVLEKIMPKEKNIKYPICIDGKLACPPEDCGSTPGYYDCIDAFNKKDNSDGLLDWLGDWNPYEFDPKKIEFEDPYKHLDFQLRD